MNSDGSASRRVFYGWYVVYAIGLVMTTTAGLAFYNLPVLLDAFVTERAFPVSLASAATAVFFIAAGFAGVAAGYLVDRFDARYVIIGSATLASLALLSVGVLRETWQLFAFYIVFGLSYGGCGLVPTTTIVARWFESRRPLALSIASTGLSLGGVVFTPFAALLILKFGLAGAAPWIALAFFLGVVPATIWIVRATPQSMGLEPERAPHADGSPDRRTAFSLPFAEALKSRFFIAVAGTFLFSLGSQVGGIAHIYRFANTRADVADRDHRRGPARDREPLRPADRRLAACQDKFAGNDIRDHRGADDNARCSRLYDGIGLHPGDVDNVRPHVR